MQLWFNLWIPWITKEAVTDVKWTQVKNFAPAQKKQIVEEIKNTKMEKLGRLSPRTNLDNSIVSFSIDKISWFKDRDTMVNEYSTKMPIETLDITEKLINDISGGYSVKEIKKSYPELNPEVIEDVYDVYHSKYNDSNAMESFAWGVVWKIPKVLWNVLKAAIDNPMTSPTWFIDKVTEALWKESIWGKVKNELTKVTEEFASDVNRWIWGNEEDLSFKLWEFAVEVAPFFINPNIGAEAAVKNLSTWKLAQFPWIQKFLNNWIVKRFLQRSMESVVDTPASIMVSEWRMPTAWEMVVGWIMQNVIWSRNIKKSKKLKWIMSERATKDNMIEWLEQWTLMNPTGKLQKLRGGAWNRLNPSQKTEKAMTLVKDEIKWRSTKVPKLYKQMKDKVTEYSESLAEPLQKINIKWMTKMKKQVKDKLVEFASEIKDYSPTVYNQINKVLKDIDSSATMYDFRQAAKKLDDLMPNSIRTAAWKWGWKEWIIYGIWRDSRGAFNNAMDEYSWKLPEWTVKETFDKMTSMYHGMGQIKENVMDIYKQTKWVKQAAGELSKTALQWMMLNQIFGVTKTDKTEF